MLSHFPWLSLFLWYGLCWAFCIYKLMPFKIKWVSLVAQMAKNLLANAEDVGSISVLGRYPGEGPGNPLQCSYLENPHGQRCLECYSPWGRKESDMTAQQNQIFGLCEGVILSSNIFFSLSPSSSETSVTQMLVHWMVFHESLKLCIFSDHGSLFIFCCYCYSYIWTFL